MIARILPLLALLIVLPDLYFYFRRQKRRQKALVLQRIMWWLPGVLMLLFTIFIACSEHFVPEEPMVLNVYLLLVGIIVIPKAVYAICSFIGRRVRKAFKSRYNYGNLVGLLLGLVVIISTFYSFFVCPYHFNIRREQFASADLPEAFDGYRVVQFSDVHAGSIPLKMLESAVDSINAQEPDLIIFTGDLQNMKPDEVDRVAPILQRLHAKDGIYSIMGNHDYTFYLNCDEADILINEEKMKRKQRDLGWRLLLNEHVSVVRGSDSIVLAGMENTDGKPERTRGDLEKTMRGIAPGAFVILLQHEPQVWRGEILEKTDAQLTLSGHTHGGQISIFGWSPVSLSLDEWGGLFIEDGRAINVSTGLGGLVPFRLGMCPEFVVLTLRRSPEA